MRTGENTLDSPQLGLLESPFSMFHNIGLCSRYCWHLQGREHGRRHGGGV